MIEAFEPEKVKEIEETILRMPKKSNQKIADLLGIGKSTVRKYRNRLIEEGRLDKEQINENAEKILQMPGKGSKKTADLLGIEESTVRYHKKRLLEQGRITEEQIEIGRQAEEKKREDEKSEWVKRVENAILQMPEASSEKIAGLLGIGRSTVQKYRKKLVDEGRIPKEQKAEIKIDENARKIEDVILQVPEESDEAIAYFLGIERSTVQSHRKRLIEEGKLAREQNINGEKEDIDDEIRNV